MSTPTFMEMLRARWAEGKFVCVGLDSDYAKIPESVRTRFCHGKSLSISDAMASFNRAIVEVTKDFVCAYKPNTAFYEEHGSEGVDALQRTVANIHNWAPGVPVILDAKRADIGNTNEGYVKFAFDYCGADAITVHPYLGEEALKPFLERADKGVIILCRTSNPGAGEFQDLKIELWGGGHVPLYQVVARQVAEKWNKNGNCALVVGATYPDELRAVRQIIGDMPILIPGIGAQGGDVEKTVAAGKDSRRQGIIINSSRGIIFASRGEDFLEAAMRETMKLHGLINQYR